MTDPVETLVNREYKWGFVTDIEADSAPAGLNEDVVRLISAKKHEPAFLLEWRLKAYRGWLKMTEPHWPNVRFDPIDYQKMVYYAAPQDGQKPLGSLDDIDPKLRETYDKLGIPAHRAENSGRAWRSTPSSTRVSVGTTYKEKLGEMGIIFCSFGEAVREHPSWFRSISARSFRPSDNFFAALNAAVFSDGSFVYVPKGVRCPMDLSTYFRINAQNTGQFERTLIVADEGASVSYLEGCTAPKRDENQLHAAVVELVALDGATIKYSTVQNWYAGDEEGKGGIYNFVTKRGKCAGASKISWTQVETGSAITWKYPSVILQGDDSVGEFYSVAVANGRQQADTGTKMIHMGQQHPQHDRLQGHLGGSRPKQLPGPGQGAAEGARCPELHPVRLDADRQPLRGAHVSLHRGGQSVRLGRARGVDLEDRRRPDLLPASSVASIPRTRSP